MARAKDHGYYSLDLGQSKLLSYTVPGIKVLVGIK